MEAHSKEYIKQKTIELYDTLPIVTEEQLADKSDKERDKFIKSVAAQRKSQIAVRDEIIQLNYKFFGYVATSTFVEGVLYEDKFQTALMSFMGMWWKFKFAPKYRSDLSFAVFFKPRLSEEIKRYLNTFSYSQKRALCLKVANQLNKPWTAVTYDDLSKANLSEDDLIALKAILGTIHPQDISDIEGFTDSHIVPIHGVEKYVSDKYDSIEELLIQEMIAQEAPIDDVQLKHLSDLYCIPYLELKQSLPKAMKILHDRLVANLY